MTAKLEAPPMISVPSADLINYRFDITEKRFDEMTRKLDAIFAQNAHFVDESRVREIVKEVIKPTEDTLGGYRWYWRTLVAAVILAIATAVGGILIKK
jgi:hypothetical protein